MKAKIRLTHEDVIKILDRFPDEKAETIAKDYGVHVQTIYKTAQRYNVKKSEAFLRSPESGRMQKGQCLSPRTQFKKGHIPCFKGRKLPYKPGHLWKKGNKPHNAGTDGEIRWRQNPGYYFIRIAENNWVFLHRFLYEQQHGKIPDGYNVIFKDGDRRNCVLENLDCVTHKELLELNFGRDVLTDDYVISKLTHRNPQLKKVVTEMPELIELKRNQIKLKRAINELTETTTDAK